MVGQKIPRTSKMWGSAVWLQLWCGPLLSAVVLLAVGAMWCIDKTGPVQQPVCFCFVPSVGFWPLPSEDVRPTPGPHKIPVPALLIFTIPKKVCYGSLNIISRWFLKNAKGFEIRKRKAGEWIIIMSDDYKYKRNILLCLYLREGENKLLMTWRLNCLSMNGNAFPTKLKKLRNFEIWDLKWNAWEYFSKSQNSITREIDVLFCFNGYLCQLSHCWCVTVLSISGLSMILISSSAHCSFNCNAQQE